MGNASKSVYTLFDLQDWAAATRGLKHPARLAVIGDPVAHSRSPQMHNPALIEAGIDCEYVRIHLQAEEFEDGIQAMKAAGFIGFNVTIPHKEAARWAVDEVSETARHIGVVNTVAIRDGRLYGHNTDGPGLQRAVREAFGRDLSDLSVLILGAGGGAGRGAAVQCVMAGCQRLVLANRTVEKATRLSEELRPVFLQEGDEESRLLAIPWEKHALETQMAKIDLVINATSISMRPDDPDALPPLLLRPDHLVYDMVYAPPRTRLIEHAEAAGARAANGLGMLLWQGALAFEYWFDRDAPVEAMRQGLSQ